MALLGYLLAVTERSSRRGACVRAGVGDAAECTRRFPTLLGQNHQ